MPYMVALVQQSLDIRLVADDELGQVLHVHANAGVLAQFEFFAWRVEQVVHHLSGWTDGERIYL